MLRRLTKKFNMHSLNDGNPPSDADSVMPIHTAVGTGSPPSPLPTSTTLTPSTTGPTSPSPESSSPDTSDSEDENDENDQAQHSKVQTLQCSKVLCEDLKVQRVSSAEKRKYSQHKCHTGSNSSASSSDDEEVREVFENHTHNPAWPYPSPAWHSWRSKVGPTHRPAPHWPTTFTSGSTFTGSSDSLHGGLGGGGGGGGSSNRPLKVLPLGHRKPKFFAQMSESFGPERPCLDFNKMQHSKRLIVVRRPLVIRHNSKVHSIQRPPTSLNVSLDISQHSFQPVLSQT